MNTARLTELMIHMEPKPDLPFGIMDVQIIFFFWYLRVMSGGRVVAEDKIDPTTADMINDILDDWVTDKTIK